ncbi:MAG: alkylation response protein AidB-like acyl-CoA dehydrogenase [Myxococcota bacterium]|jgi:alkylation response protein AidB-like acyl-CoA dehydrogenase
MSDSKKLATELEAREVAESARETEWEKATFARGLYDGRLDLDLIHPLPASVHDEDPAEAEGFLARLTDFAARHIDGDQVDREGWVPDEVLDGLRKLGCFGIKIPKEYGGLGFSQVTYNKALSIVCSRCGSTGAFLSAHQSIGVPQPLMLFGTTEQKETFLPRLAAGALSAFALTEADAGSDPANLSTVAVPTSDGEAFILNGEKLWTTNGPRAELLVVMARTPAREGVRGKKPITAFIVETGWEGVEVAHTCEFMGLKGLSNGVMRFTNVRVPKENVLWGEGKGLKLALITLNTGRLSLPAFCATAGKGCLEVSRKWSAERVQWGVPIGKHDAVAQKLGRIAAETFAMDSVVQLTSSMADAKRFDVRLEAAIAKMWNSESAWGLINDTVQIRGGRGYETHDSLAARGDGSYPVERWMRDLRINLIFEGSSEIMRLFIAREAVDHHLKVAGDMVDPRAPFGRRVSAAMRAGLYYAWWYPTRWFGWGQWPRYSEFGPLATHLRFVNRNSRKLARSIFYSMMRFGGGLERRQAVLGRIVEIGAELFVTTAACVRAQGLVTANPSDRTPYELADAFSRQSREKVKTLFRQLFRNADASTAKVARRAMEGAYAWAEEGVVTFEMLEKLSDDAPRTPAEPEPATVGTE